MSKINGLLISFPSPFLTVTLLYNWIVVVFNIITLNSQLHFFLFITDEAFDGGGQQNMWECSSMLYLNPQTIMFR